MAANTHRAGVTAFAVAFATISIALIGPLARADAANCGLGNAFGRMFPTASPATWSDAELSALSDAVTEVTHLEPVGKGADDEMKNIPAGYTYAGQFIDHDIVLDPMPLSLSSVDLSTLRNLRTPHLDLDSVYGAGPSGSPALYEADGLHFKLGAPLSGATSDPGARDVPRGPNGRALMPDARDDENRIVASLHSIMTRFHNKIVDDLLAAGVPANEVFAKAREQVIWHYQYAVVTDFLPRMTSKASAEGVIHRGAKAWKTALRHYDSCQNIPIEFSAAPFRFGHSMVRDEYEINDAIGELPVFSVNRDPRASLVGFSPSPSDFAIDWDLFFKGPKPAKGTEAPEVQNAYRMDNSLVPQLRLLPLPAIDGLGPAILSTRTLLRGRMVGLPTGQDVARSMGLKPLPDEKILIGPATGEAPMIPITEIAPSFSGRAPLWTYILAEAVDEAMSIKNGAVGTKAGNWNLGPVGARIVNETFAGLLAADPASIVNNASFEPRYGNSKDRFGFADLIRFATS